MSELWVAILLGCTSAGLFWGAERWPALAWFALTPVFVVALQASPVAAACAAALAGVSSTTSVMLDDTQRVLVPLTAAVSAVTWGASYAAAAAVMQISSPGWAVFVLPLASVLALLPMRGFGAPRWVTNPLARTQERWLPVVHIARLGGDLLVAATLAAVAAAIALLWSARGAHWPAASAALLSAAGALFYGFSSLKRAEQSADAALRVRMAAVAVNVPPPASGTPSGLWPFQSPHARDVAAALSRYEQPIQRAAAEGAELVLLPECAVCVDADSRVRWLETLSQWAKREQVAIIAPFFDESIPRNELAIIDVAGRLVGSYAKQHPALRLEPPCSLRCTPGPHHLTTRSRTLSVSAVICVDLDYGDLIATARKVGGVLNVPANDWPVFEQLHHRTAVWAAAISGVPLLRSTGHGICSVYDGAGRVLAASSSLAGPVVLVADVPLAASQLGA